jgi:hypothetical protein
MSTATISERKVTMRDLSGYKRFETLLNNSNNGLTPRHTVGQAVEHYLEKVMVRKNGLDFMAFSRGVRLDNKMLLGDLPEEDTQEWTVMPEVAAGGR